MTDEDAFHRMLDADPDNFGARLVFADWLEEQGDRRAAGMRWMGENGTRPLEPNMNRWNGADWAWHASNLKTLRSDMIYYTLPNKFRVKSLVSIGSGVRRYPSRREAEDAFCLAFAALADAEAEMAAAQTELRAAENAGCEFMAYCTCIAAHERAEAGKQTQITCARCAKIRSLQNRIKKLKRAASR